MHQTLSIPISHPLLQNVILVVMKITEKQVDEFIVLYKQEYGIELERSDALGQVNALIFLVSRMLSNIECVEENKEMQYNVNTKHRA